MFFRLKTTRSGRVLKLVESYRDDIMHPRHRAVASLGDAPLPRDDWKVVAKTVEDRLYGKEVLVDRKLNDIQTEWVDRIVRQVGSEGRWNPLARPPSDGLTIDGVRVEEVTHTDTAELGPVLLGWEMWKRLGLHDLLTLLGLNRSQNLAAAISVINRLTDPASDHSLPEWYRRTALPELMGNQLRGAGDDRFYRASDILLTHQSAIERHLRGRQCSLFNLGRTVLLFDLTNTHFEGVCQHNPKAKRGANKQKRNDCPQIVVGMVFDQFGFEMTHSVFDGNLNDSKSLLKMIEEMNAVVADDKKKPLVVMDGGIATRANLRLLHEHGFGYLVNDSRVQRHRYLKEFRQKDDFKVVKGREGKAPVWVCVMNDPRTSERDDDVPAERIVLCRSDPRGEKEQAIISNAEKRLLDDLQKLASRVEQKQLKDRLKIERTIGRLLARHSRARRFYQVALQEDGIDLRLTWTKDDELLKEASELFGCYVLRTDEQTLSEHDIWRLYISLTQAEDGFKALKSDLGLRPNRHQKEARVDAHVFICVLAYHLLRSILWTLEQKEDYRNWDTLKRVLRTHCYTTILLPTSHGETHRIRRAGQPEECQKAIYRNLGISWDHLPRNRTVVRTTPGQTEVHSNQTTL